jgi:hypothetical protein
MFNRKLKGQVNALRFDLNSLIAKVDRHYERVTSLRTRVGEEGLAALKRASDVGENIRKLRKDIERLTVGVQPKYIIGVDPGAGDDKTFGAVLAPKADGSYELVAEFERVGKVTDVLIHRPLMGFDLSEFARMVGAGEGHTVNLRSAR